MRGYSSYNNNNNTVGAVSAQISNSRAPAFHDQAPKRKEKEREKKRTKNGGRGEQIGAKPG